MTKCPKPAIPKDHKYIVMSDLPDNIMTVTCTLYYMLSNWTVDEIEQLLKSYDSAT